MLAKIQNGKVLCFECYPVKDELKKLRFRWDPERKVWHKSGYTEEDLKVLRVLGFEIMVEAKKEIDERIYNKIRQMYPYAFEHQVVASTLAVKEKSFLIGDEPGVGKTLEAIIYIDYLLYHGKIKRAVVFCPSSIKRQWRDEIVRFIGETPIVLEGPPAQRERIYRIFEGGKFYPVLIANYELIIRDDLYNFLKRLGNFALVMDEASRVKNKQSKTFKRLRDIARRTDYKLALTGTPIENNLQEFWAIAHILRGKEFMSFKEFEREHVRYFYIDSPKVPFPIKKVAGYKNIAKFVARVEPFYLRRKKKDVREDLPDLIEHVREIELTPIQKKIEDYLIEKAKTEKGIVFEGIIQLLRVVGDDPRLLRETSSEFGREIYALFRDEIEGSKNNRKVEELSAVLEEHEGKVIVFTSFSKVAKVLAKTFGGLLITGEIPSKERARIIGELKSREDKRLLVATDALTYGASLDECDTVVHYDIPWSVGKLVQRTDRIHRITSTRGKSVYYFVSNGIERKVWDILQGKVKLFQEVVEGEALGDIRAEIVSLVKKNYKNTL